MLKENVIDSKAKKFSIRIIRMYQYLSGEKKEFVLSKQILRSGTSIGANIVEAEAGISKKDFQAKMYISFKECCETEFWLDIMHETDYVDDKTFNDLMPKCSELNKMLSAITKSTKESFE